MLCVREIKEPEQEETTIKSPEIEPDKSNPDGATNEDKAARDKTPAKVEKSPEGKKVLNYYVKNFCIFIVMQILLFCIIYAYICLNYFLKVNVFTCCS
jgi:hypothetical protein